ncbi:MAG: MerR family transcriptional regulator [Dermabacter sp.]|nr:MerR family transcriptional regulator [Dermabacter sp.]
MPNALKLNRGSHRDLTVGETAALIGVSVRTLHYWDEIAVVTPSGRSRAGYRLYSERDLERLHEVLIYRETGMSLAEVRELLVSHDSRQAATHADAATAREVPSERERLVQQREVLLGKVDHLHRMLRAVDSLIERIDMGEKLTPEQRAEILGKDWNPEWDNEAKNRWGNTSDWAASRQYQESQTAEDLESDKARIDAVEEKIASAIQRDVDPRSSEAITLADEYRRALTWYDVTPAKHVLIARGYVEDSRFRDRFESRQAGMAEWLKDAIDANAREHGIDPDTAEWQ